jgi:hypothetical protein
LKLSSDCKFDIPKWKTERLFKMQLYHNIIQYKNYKGEYRHLPYTEKINFLNENSSSGRSRSFGNIKCALSTSADIQFQLFDIAGKCDYHNLQRHISESKLKIDNKLLLVGSSECSHCPEAKNKGKTYAETNNYVFEIEEYPTIAEAIKRANELSPDVKIDSIPAFFINSVYTKI